MRIVLKYPIILCPPALWVEVETARKPVGGSPLSTASVMLAGFAVLDTPSKKRGLQQPWCLVYRSRYVNLLYTIKLFLILKNKWMNGICDILFPQNFPLCRQGFFFLEVFSPFFALLCNGSAFILHSLHLRSGHMPKLVSSTSSLSPKQKMHFFFSFYRGLHFSHLWGVVDTLLGIQILSSSHFSKEPKGHICHKKEKVA